MNPKKVNRDMYNDCLDGVIVFDIPGKKTTYKGLLERMEIMGTATYLPKLHVHEKSSWCLIFVHPWMDRYTVYMGNYMNTEKEAMAFISSMQDKLQKGVSVEDIVQTGFQDAVIYCE